MNKRKSLGQHFLNSKNLARTIITEASIGKDDVVLEIGTGLGVLTPLLCEKANKVISIEADKELFERALSRFSEFENLKLEYGDGFKTKKKFSVFVSNLPYSKSREAIEWLASISFSHGIIMVQKEFAEKLLCDAKSRRAISIIAQHVFEIKKIKNIDKKNFSPPPKVDSVILKLIQRRKLSTQIIHTVNRIFSYRRKTIQNIFKQFGKSTTIDKRLDDLSEDEIIELAKKLHK